MPHNIVNIIVKITKYIPNSDIFCYTDTMSIVCSPTG